MSEKLTYRDLFTEKNYLKSYTANMINRFGDSIDALAFTWMVYEVTGDPSWSAIVFGLNALPTILLMPFAGVVVEKYDKRTVMVLCDIGRALLVTLTVILYLTSLIQPWMLGAFTFLMSTFEAFRIPAGLAIYPKIVPREKYTLATSFSQASSNVFQILGTGAFGLIVAAWGLGAAMLVNAATFAISAGFIHSIRVPKESHKDVSLSPSHFFAQLKEGFSYFYAKKIVFMICLIGALVGVLTIPLNALNAPYIRDSLHMGETALSVQSIASLAGVMIGTALFPFINRRISKSRLFIIGGFTAALGHGALVLITTLSSPAWVYVALAGVSFLFGFGTCFVSVVVNVAFMEQVAPEYLGRVGSIFNALASALVPLASFGVAGIAAAMPVNDIFLLFGTLVAALFLVLSFSRLFRTIDAPVAPEGEAQA